MLVNTCNSAVVTQEEDSSRALLENGADVNTSNNRGTTPLMMAALGNYCTIAQLLLDEGANVNTKRPDGESALSLAREKNFDEMLALLLEADAKE